MLFSNLFQYLKENKSFHIMLNCCSDLCEIRDVELLDGTQKQYDTDIVYLGYSDAFSQEVQPLQCILADSGPALFPYACTDRATVPSNELFAVFNASKQFIQEQEPLSLYEELVRKGHVTHSLDEVINFASIKMGNALIFCDKKFRILSYSTSIPIKDALWKENVERGYCTYEFITNVMSLESIRDAAANSEAIEVSCPQSPYRKCSSKVFLNGVQVGFVLMIEGAAKFTARHLTAMSDISRAVSFMLGCYQPDLLRYSSADQQLLEALLIGTPAELLADSIRHLRVSDAMYALCIQPQSSFKESEIKQQLCPVIQHIFPDAYMTIHDNAIALLVPDRSSMTFEDTQKQMLKIMADLHLDTGISLVFSRMDEFYTAYQQARTVLEWNKRIPNDLKAQILWDRRYPAEHRTHRYSEIAFFELLEQFPDPSALTRFIHPALPRLKKFDEETGNDLYHTLEVYLQCFHNNKETANVLCIHRNSLTYRMDKIREVGKVNVTDPATEFLLCLSYKMAEYLKIRHVI